MKLLGNLILMVATIAGSLAVTTSYLAPTSLPDDKLVGLTLNEDAGLQADPSKPDSFKPIAEKDTVLTAEIVQSLRDNTFDAKGEPHTVKYLTVKEFQFSRWIGKWVFLASLAGLFVGALLVRGSAKREIASSMEKSAVSGQSPQKVLASITAEINTLQANLPGMANDDERLDAIIDRIGHLQGTDILTFIEARPLLVGQLGLGGYAEMMGRFAAAERQINRAWSTAADRFLPDSMQSLELAETLLKETTAKLG